ncbi:DUF2786 domain-containing protein [Halomonas sp. AOP43-A1-21]
MNERIIERIKKCLAHGSNSNPHERANALRQAQKLMDKHGLSELDITLSEVKAQVVDAGAGKTLPSYVVMLAQAIGHAFGAEMIIRTRRSGQRWKGYIEYYGVGSAAEVAGYAFDVLRRQLKRDRQAFMATIDKRRLQKTKTRKGDLYCMGWVMTAIEIIKPHVPSDKEKAVVAAYAADRWPKPLESAKTIDRVTGAKKNDNDYSAMERGIRDGEKVQFHQGVKGTEQARLTAP